MTTYKPFRKIKFGTQQIKYSPRYYEETAEPSPPPKKKEKEKQKDEIAQVKKRKPKARSKPKLADLDDVDYKTWRRAMAIKAHNILDDEGVEQAKEFIEKNKLNYTIDEDNSNEYGMVVKDEISGAKEMVMRGTNIEILKRGKQYLKSKVELKGGVGGMLFDPNELQGDFDLSAPKPAIKSTRRAASAKQVSVEEMTDYYNDRRATRGEEPGVEMSDRGTARPARGVGGMLFDPNVEAGNFRNVPKVPRPKHVSAEEMQDFYNNRQPGEAEQWARRMTGRERVPEAPAVPPRGTDEGRPRQARRFAEDLATDVDLLAGSGRNTKSFREQEKIFKANPDIERFIGFSKSGGTGMLMGEMYNKPTTTFNPATGKGLWDMMGENAGKPLETRPKHEVFKTTDDFASSWLDVMDNVGRVPNVSIKRLGAIDSLFNPVESHSLEQFTTRGVARGAPLSHKMAEDLHAHTQMHQDMMAQRAVDEWKGKDGEVGDDEIQPDRGSFTNFWNDFNDNSPTRAFGSEGSGVSSASPHVLAWERDGGDITPEEREHLDANWKKNGSPPKMPKSFTDEEYANFDPVEHASELKFKQEAFDEESGLKQATTKSGFKEAVSEGLAPSEVGKGLLGGIIGNEVMKTIDPNGKAGVVGDTAGSGAIAGAIAGGASEIIPGAAGAVIGVEASNAISEGLTSLGAGKEVSTLGGDVGGGALGGLGAVGTGALMTGEALALETGGASLAVGAAIGLGAYLWNWGNVGSTLESAGKSAGDWLKRTF